MKFRDLQQVLFFLEVNVKKHSFNVYVVGSLALALIGLVGCESKFAESSPDTVQITGVSLDERISQKAAVDGKIEEVQRGADKAKTILNLFRRIKNPNAQEDVYTPLDFLLDANEELKSKIPENKEGRLVRFGKMTLPVKSMKEECRAVETLLQTSSLFESPNSSKVIGERLTYSLKTCTSDGLFVDVATADWVGSVLELKLINKNLEGIFNDLLVANTLNTSNCKIKQNEQKILESVTCENFNVQISVSETGLIRKLAFRNSDQIRFEVVADIFENGQLKATGKIQVPSEGPTLIDFKKIDGSEITIN